MASAKIKKGDKVVVLAGRDKGKQGEVISVMPTENRALVRGVNMVRRHTKQSAQSPEGGISFFFLNNVSGYMGELQQWTPWLTAALPGMIYTLLSLAAFAWLVFKR